jgi:hypothetical protein
MTNRLEKRRPRRLACWIAPIALAGMLAQCRSAGTRPSPVSLAPTSLAQAAPWQTVYEVLLHPRCANCHPAGDAPLQGDDGRPHAQNIQRGPEGKGLFAQRCDACHQTHNLPGAHLPPGAPNWHLPHPDMPLVFAGVSSSELCRALRDPAHNGGRTPEQILEHVAKDELVLWGWAPGEGRAPVPIPHEEFVLAMSAWIESGCACPE